MGDKSAIEWTEATWNPVTGCSKVSPGCDHCYAETLSLRFGWSPKPWTHENAGENVRLRRERLDQPLRWRRPRMVFVNSMSDLFHELVPDEYVLDVFARMALADWHTFQVLTKRPRRALALVGRKGFHEEIQERVERAAFDGRARTAMGRRSRLRARARAWRTLVGWPLPNVWLGVSIESWWFNWRADVLREIPAAVRFISAEPLLATLYPAERPERNLDLTGIDWLIVGGESGASHRPMDPEWARELLDACLAQRGFPEGGADLRPGGFVPGVTTAFFFKQWGGRTPKAGGRELDGREWNEMPAVAEEPQA